MVALRYTPLRILLATLFALHCAAQTVQDAWISPSNPSFSTTIQIGETFKVQWTDDLAVWFGKKAPSVDPTDTTLWLTIANDTLEYLVKVSGEYYFC